jgi:hypothetical protein
MTKLKKTGLVARVERIGAVWNEYTVLVEIAGWKRPLSRHWSRYKDNILKFLMKVIWRFWAAVTWPKIHTIGGYFTTRYRTFKLSKSRGIY